MKKHKISLLFVLSLTLIMLNSCASAFELAGDALNKGDYITAVVKSLEALEKEPGLAGAEALLQDAWRKANKEWGDEINYYEKNSAFDNISMELPDWVKIKTNESVATVEDLEKTLPVYDKLIKIHQIIENAKRFNLYPDASGLAKKQLANKQKISDIYFAMGDNALALEGRTNARTALNYFNKVKSLISNYPTLSEKYDEAVEKATVKVFVVGDNNYLVKSKLEEMFNQKELIDIVISNTPLYQGDLEDDIRQAILNVPDADILVSFRTNIKGSASLKTDVTPFYPGVTAVKDWKIGKTYLLAKGSSTISYSVYDLKNNTLLSKENYTIEDSTDFKFSVSSIMAANIKNEEIQIGNMTQKKYVFSAALEPGVSIFTFEQQLQAFQSISWSTMDPHSPVFKSRPSFKDEGFQNARALSTIPGLNNHLFIPFALIKIPSQIKDVNDQYFGTYNATLGVGLSGRIQTFEVDQYVFNSLLAKMNSASFKNDSLKIFLSEDIAEQTVKSIYSKALPYLK